MRICRSAFGLGNLTDTLSQSTTMPASSGSEAVSASISACVMAAARAQSERVSPRLRLAASSSAEYLTIHSFFATARSPERNDSLIFAAPHPHDCIKLAVNLGG